MNCLSFLACVGFLAASSPVLAETPTAPVPVADGELDKARGGYLFAGDVAFEFGATLRTFQDGALAMQTQVTWTPQGQQILRTGPDGHQSVALRDDDLRGAAGGHQVTAGGSTIIQNVTDGQIANILLNTDSGRSFRQETDVTLSLPGFGAVQGDMSGMIAGIRLNDDIAQSSPRALGN